MASFFYFLLLSSLFFVPASRADFVNFVIPVKKNSLQYVARIHQRTPLTLLNLVLDLGGRFLFGSCKTPATLQAVGVYSECHNNDTCDVIFNNPFSRDFTYGELAYDNLAVVSTDGYTSGPLVNLPNFVFPCVDPVLLQGLAEGADGVVGLGRTRFSLPYQLADVVWQVRVFATCLSPHSDGVVFFGDGPYNLLQNNDVSQDLIFTKLLVGSCSANYCSKDELSTDYFISVTSIKVNDKPVIGATGGIGTKISTVDPYTVLETSIYNNVTAAFDSSLGNVTRVRPRDRFKFCYLGRDFKRTPVGPAVPHIDLFLQSESVYWRIYGANSMVSYRGGKVLCLAFVDGGLNPPASIVIGGHQLEDNLVQFDLAWSWVGFSSSLLLRNTSCANFNFTSAT